MHAHPPTPASLPRSSRNEDDQNLVYWEHAPHPRPRPSTSRNTPVKMKAHKRDSSTAEMPSPSKTVVDEDSTPTPPILGAQRAASDSRRKLREHKRLRDRQGSCAENDTASNHSNKNTTTTTTTTTTTSHSGPRLNPGIDNLLNQLAQKAGGTITATKGKAKAFDNPTLPVQKQVTKSPQQRPAQPPPKSTTPILRRQILAPDTAEAKQNASKRIPETRTPMSMLGTTVSKPGLNSNQLTPIRSSTGTTKSPLTNIPKAVPLQFNKPTTRVVPNPSRVSIPNPSDLGTRPSTRPPPLGVNNQRNQLPKAQPVVNKTLQTRTPTIVPTKLNPTAPIKPSTAYKPPTITKKPMLTTTTKITINHTKPKPVDVDESQFLLSGLSPDDLDWNFDD